MQKGMKAIALLIASFLAFSIMPIASATNFTGNNSDYGSDTNGNGIYEYLVVQVEIFVDQDGEYSLNGTLYNSAWQLIANTYTTTQSTLSNGTQIMILNFNGNAIYNSNQNGPYNADLYLWYNDNGTWTPVDSQVYQTGFYYYTDFEPPPSSFTGNYDNYGEDENNNTYYDFLVITAQVNITQEDNYTVQGSLRDVNGTKIDEKENSSHFAPGEYTIALYFSGIKIYKNGYNGTYNVDLLLNKNSDTVDTDTYTTDFYSYTEFESPGANFTGEYSHRGKDTNGNTYFDFLDVNIKVNVTVSGNYKIFGEAKSSGNENITNNTKNYNLNEGVQNVPFEFEGIEIYNSGLDGYNLYFNLYDSNDNLLDELSFSATYQYTDFEIPGADYIEGSETNTAVDENNDTYYEYLLVNITFNIQTESDYRLEGELRNGANTTTITTNFTYIRLQTGVQTITLRFEGGDINNSGEDSPYNVIWKLYQISGTRGEVEVQNGSFQISGYTHEQFVPEFLTLLIPIFAMFVLFYVARRRK